MSWLLAASLAALTALAGGIWIVARGRSGRIASAEDAAQAADASLPGFATAGAVVGADGAAALAVDAKGRVAVMKRRGARITVREVPWSAMRATGAGIVVETDERGFGAVALAGVDALDIRRLSPAPTTAARR